MKKIGNPVVAKKNPNWEFLFQSEKIFFGVEKNFGQNFRDLRVQNILEKLVLQFNSQVFDFYPLLEKKRDSKSCFLIHFPANGALKPVSGFMGLRAEHHFQVAV